MTLKLLFHIEQYILIREILERAQEWTFSLVTHTLFLCLVQQVVGWQELVESFSFSSVIIGLKLASQHRLPVLTRERSWFPIISQHNGKHGTKWITNTLTLKMKICLCLNGILQLSLFFIKSNSNDCLRLLHLILIIYLVMSLSISAKTTWDRTTLLNLIKVVTTL